MAAEHALGLASDLAIMSLLALSAYLLLIVGRISFGQQAFFGLGAYASGLASAMAHWPLPAALALGVAVGAIASALVAAPTLRLSGLAYAVATLAFAEMARVALLGWHFQVEVDGQLVGPAGGEGFRDIRWLFENDVSPGEYLVLCLAVLAAVLALLTWVERSRLGLALRSTGHDDLLATAQGLPVQCLRFAAATAAGALAALAGGLYAHRTTYVEPSLFDPMLGVHAVGYALIGGLGTAFGPLLGVAFDLGLLNAARVFEGWRMVVFGGVVALFLRWRPRGLLDEALVQRLQAWRRTRARSALPRRAGTVVPAVVLLAAGGFAVPADAQPTTPSRPRIELRCEAVAIGPTLDCLVTVAARDGRPLDGAQLTLGATMPSMPMAHRVKPAPARPTGRPGEYRGTLELEMSGVWAVQVDLVAAALRDRAVVRLQADECPDNRPRCPVPPAGKP